MSLTDLPNLVGTQSDAFWAVKFYEKNGFKQFGKVDSENLLKTFWSISENQI